MVPGPIVTPPEWYEGPKYDVQHPARPRARRAASTRASVAAFWLFVPSAPSTTDPLSRLPFGFGLSVDVVKALPDGVEQLVDRERA